MICVAEEWDRPERGIFGKSLLRMRHILIIYFNFILILISVCGFLVYPHS